MVRKRVLVTGSTDGIGKQTALALAKKGFEVIIHGRNTDRCQKVLAEIEKASSNENLAYFVADFSELGQVRTMAKEIVDRYDRLDVLINNAGVYMKERLLTSDGFEMTFAVNHLSHFLLTELLLDLIKSSAPARVVLLSSMLHKKARFDLQNLQGEKEFDGYRAYALSKFSNMLHAFELADRLSGSGVTVNCLHPGVIGTKMLRDSFGIAGDSVETGAATPVYLASSDDVKEITGEYFIDQQVQEPLPLAYDQDIRQSLWDASYKMVAPYLT